MKSPRLIYLESPYAGAIAENVAYARRCMRDATMRGESAIASHLLWTQEGILDDTIPEERARGIACGFAWAMRADASAFYCDRSWSRGMWLGLRAAYDAGRPIEIRSLSFPIPFVPTRGHIADMLAGAGV